MPSQSGRSHTRKSRVNKTFVILRALSGSWCSGSIINMTRHAMMRSSAPAVAMLVLAFAAPFSAQAQKPSASLTADLPPGAMQAKATTTCLECHEARIILQQRLSKSTWTKEVDKMTKWGALVDPADRDPLIDYLSTNFSPDKPPYAPQRTAGSGKTSK